MNDEAHRVIVGLFCKRRHLSCEAVAPALSDIICAVTAPYLLMIECLDELDANPTNGLLIKLIDRSYEAAAGALALISIGHLREAEILSRSVFESSVTTAFIVEKKPSERFAQFFRAYVRNERDQNNKWSKDIEVAPMEVRQNHQDRITQKNEAMDAYEQFIESYIAHCDVDHDQTKTWPGLIDRLTELDRRIDYRTVYAAMCSQSHHDAEDVLNYFFANSIVGADGLAKRIEREADTFSIFMVLFGVRWFAESIVKVCQHLDFPTVVAEGINSVKRITAELESTAPYLDTGGFPESWRSRM